jgi:purine-binding chemotaxis protein CheW
VEILKVQEIVGGSGISRLPRAPAVVCGQVDLRGRRIPVVDVRTCLHLPRGAGSEKTCIIVADVPQGGRVHTVGLLVDEVCEVLNLRDEDIHEPTLGGGGMEEIDFINGLGRLPGRDVVLVDVRNLLDPRDLDALEGMN